MTEPNKYRIAIVTATFYKEISASLLEGAMAALQSAGIARERIAVYEVPGAYEIPLMAKQLILTKRWDAVVALGCVIRGETIHFEMIAQATSLNLQQISLETGVPITSGILMVENHEQALQRCGLMPKNPRSRSGREGEAPTALPAEGATCLPAGTAQAPINRGSEAAHAAVAVLKTLGELTQL